MWALLGAQLHCTLHPGRGTGGPQTQLRGLPREGGLAVAQSPSGLEVRASAWGKMPISPSAPVRHWPTQAMKGVVWASQGGRTYVISAFPCHTTT